MTAGTLCTIGYEKTLLKHVLATLGGAGVATLIDVRDRPISRRPAPGDCRPRGGRPGGQLAAAVEDAGIAQAAPSCLLCYESDWQTCHRRRVAEILCQRNGFAVRHLTVCADTP